MKTLWIVALLAMGIAPGAAGAASLEDVVQKNRWVQEHFAAEGGQLPFSFNYNNQPADRLLAGWTHRTEQVILDARRTQIADIWTAPHGGLEVRCVRVDYRDFPAVEWTVYFRNTGSSPAALLSNIEAIDTEYHRPGGPFTLRGTVGDWCAANSYEPFALPLEPHAINHFGSAGGRPTNHAFPYYNLTTAEGGLFIALGWPGQWSSDFRAQEGGVRIVAGQDGTRLVLQPGEQVRSPLVALLFWKGADPGAAQNLWRRWMLADNLPRNAEGLAPPPQLNACSSHQFNEMTRATEADQKQFIAGYLAKDIRLDYWWMDAGWYPCGGKWENTGTWEPDQTRFPHGLRPISDYAHDHGVKIITWFEPERVGDPESWLAQHHPEWLLGHLLNLGNPAALRWLIEHVDRTLREQGIDYYRQDFNLDPLANWQGADQADRQGMTENLYVQGYLAYWDALRQRHPGMLIDSCASGGRRNDLETMRRAVPLLRSDYIFEPIGQQSQTYGLASWLPFYGTGTEAGAFDAYRFRSTMCPGMILCYDVREDNPAGFGRVANFVRQWRNVAPSMLGDYFPLTPYSLATTSWIAWQFDRPEAGQGLIQAFRRQGNAEPNRRLILHGLEPDAQYEVTDLDQGQGRRLTGRELTTRGLEVMIPSRPGAAVIAYRRL